MNRQIILRRRPSGLLAEGDTEIVSRGVAELAENQARVRTVFLAMDPVTRVILERDIGLVPPAGLGEPLRSFGSGIVVESRCAALPLGAGLSGFFDWADWQIVEPGLRTHVLHEGEPLDMALNRLGHTAMAAYFGLFEIGRPKASDTVVISGAAGAVGTVAGQLAKSRGCHVIGIAGGAAKTRWLVDELRFDAAIDHTGEDVEERLASLCPAGVDLFFDNVGGALLDQVFAHLAPGARIVVCGASSQYLTGSPLPKLKAVADLAAKSATMAVFNAMDYAPRFAQAAAAMRALVDEGKLVFPQMLLHGLESAPDALNALFDGRSRGRVLVKVGDEQGVGRGDSRDG